MIFGRERIQEWIGPRPGAGGDPVRPERAQEPSAGRREPSARLHPERRAYPRYRVSAPHELKIEFGPLGCRPLEGYAEDISCGGLRVRFDGAEWARRKNTPCFVRFLGVPEHLEPQSALGIVRRVGEEGGHAFAAIEFTTSLGFLDLVEPAKRPARQAGGSSRSSGSSNSIASS